MSAILLILSVVLGVCKSAVYNRYAKSARPGIGMILQFNVISYGIAFLVVLCFGPVQRPSLFTVLTALGYGLIVFSLQALSVTAMTVGPMSLTSLMVFFGMIIPSLAGPIFWKEPFGALQAAGILLMVASILLLYRKDAAQTAVTVRWWFLVAFCFLLSGGAGLMEKIHQTSAFREERTAFLMAAYLIMFGISSVSLLALKTARKEKLSWPAPIFVLGGITGLIIGFYNRINLILSGTLNSMVYYPIANGGGLLLTVAVSILFFREKLTPKMYVGIGVGLLSILLLSIPV